MNKINLSKEWIRENSKIIKKAYSIAAVNKYDLKSKEISIKLLKEIDPENATEENAEIFSKILQLFDRLAKKKLLKEKSEIK